jgi:hypothetical protein
MIENIFVDSLGKVHVVGGAARLEFFVLLPSSPNAEGHPMVAPRLRLVMAPETLVHLHAAMRDLVQQFVARGILRPVEPAITEVTND